MDATVDCYHCRYRGGMVVNMPGPYDGGWGAAFVCLHNEATVGKMPDGFVGRTVECRDGALASIDGWCPRFIVRQGEEGATGSFACDAEQRKCWWTNDVHRTLWGVNDLEKTLGREPKVGEQIQLVCGGAERGLPLRVVQYDTGKLAWLIEGE